MGDPKERSIGGGGSLSNAVRPVRICVCVHRHHVWQMMRFAWDNERFLSFLVLFLFPRSCTHSAGTMFLNVPSGLRPELIYMHESVSRLCRGHAYFLESLLDLRFFGISFISTKLWPLLRFLQSLQLLRVKRARRTQKQTKCDPVQTPDWLRFSECGAAL